MKSCAYAFRLPARAKGSISLDPTAQTTHRAVKVGYG